MPWILKNFIKEHITVAVLLLCMIFCLIFKLYILSIVCVLGIIYVYGSILLYREMLKIYKRPAEIFSPKSKTRNVKYLIIGDMYKAESYCDRVELCAPGRNLESCFEILKHTHSILDENNGTIVIAIKRKNVEKQGFSMFDVPFFHHITVSKLKQENHMPDTTIKFVIKHPVLCIEYLLGIKSRKYNETDIPAEKIKKFCQERGYKVIFKIA